MNYDTVEKQQRRREEIIRGWLAKSKYKGDYWWRKVEQETGQGDYLASDEGEAPKGAYGE